MPPDAAPAPEASEGQRPRTVSLRRLLCLACVAVSFALAISFGFFHHAADEVAEERAEAAAYHARIEGIVHHHARALLGADVAIRQALADGTAPRPALPADPVAALDTALAADDRRALAPSLATLRRADERWRAAAAALTAGASSEALAALRIAAIEVTQASDRVEDTLVERERATVADLSARSARFVSLGLAALGVAALLGVLFLIIVLRQTAQPITALVRHAASGTPTSDTGSHVTEICDLADALQRLRAQAHERQVSLEQSRRSAVSLSRFAELVQGTSRPLEIRAAVATMLEGALPQGEVQVIEWNDARNRMQRTWPELRDRPSEVAFDAQTCPAIRRKRPLRADAGSDQACDCAFGAPSEGSYACIPMISAGDISGLVNIRSRKVGAWTRADVVGATPYVNFASGALGHIHVLESTRDRALRDGLTGAYNRRFLDEYLLKRLADSLRHHQPLSVLLLDLDHFKTLNDTFGHAVGDRALIEFASAVHGQIRTGDAFVRYGGEEFVLVLTGTDLEGARIVAERVRASAERIRLEVTGDGPPPRVTASIGVATVGEHGASMPEILAAADRAVYRAKARGRNRVEIADPTPPPSGN